jgi:hypothetical protein
LGKSKLIALLNIAEVPPSEVSEQMDYLSTPDLKQLTQARSDQTHKQGHPAYLLPASKSYYIKSLAKHKPLSHVIWLLQAQRNIQALVHQPRCDRQTISDLDSELCLLCANNHSRTHHTQAISHSSHKNMPRQQQFPNLLNEQNGMIVDNPSE